MSRLVYLESLDNSIKSGDYETFDKLTKDRSLSDIMKTVMFCKVKRDRYLREETQLTNTNSDLPIVYSIMKESYSIGSSGEVKVAYPYDEVIRAEDIIESIKVTNLFGLEETKLGEYIRYITEFISRSGDVAKLYGTSISNVMMNVEIEGVSDTIDIFKRKLSKSDSLEKYLAGPQSTIIQDGKKHEWYYREGLGMYLAGLSANYFPETDVPIAGVTDVDFTIPEEFKEQDSFIDIFTSDKFRGIESRAVQNFLSREAYRFISKFKQSRGIEMVDWERPTCTIKRGLEIDRPFWYNIEWYDSKEFNELEEIPDDVYAASYLFTKVSGGYYSGWSSTEAHSEFVKVMTKYSEDQEIELLAIATFSEMVSKTYTNENYNKAMMYRDMEEDYFNLYILANYMSR